MFSIKEFGSIALLIVKEVMSTWKCPTAVPKVSILCCTYNQESCIQNALHGFLIQKTTFPFEVIVHDDASEDGTADIVREFVAQYPGIISPIFQSENQLSKGKKISLLCYPHFRGEYVAMCDGDDFWLDPNKLENQFQTLEKERNVDLSFHPAYSLNSNSGAVSIIGRHSKISQNISAKKIISGGGSYCPTSSLFFRKNVFDRLGDWFKNAPFGDLFLQALAAESGGAAYLADVASVWRSGDARSWTNEMQKVDIIRGFQSKIDKAMIGLSSEMDPKFSATIIQHRGDQYCMLAGKYLNCGLYNEFKSSIEKSWDLYPRSSWRQCIMYFSKEYKYIVRLLPKLHNYLKKFGRRLKVI